MPAPIHSKRAGRPHVEHRRVMNGMFWVLCSGAPWRDLPDRYGPWKTVYNRFNRWSKQALSIRYLIGYCAFWMKKA
ncbi:protein of unknown function [Xenorhabdus poinarii G6]|uniref:Insertion element IS402-like domain-containing protein n=1 Tax=Xenorhabdus poinarii G6 TaxID=1354304 RepID=A0A068R787_9GAMM|nr:protein of unknown function [Xenorhabdus poinarii G6]